MSADPVAQDKADRWLPTGAAVRHAQALLAAEPLADLAAIPMIQPGKTYGWWRLGQQVETVAGVVFIGINGDAPAGSAVPDYAWARDMASMVAATVLGADREGTVGWATVDRDGYVTVTEDCIERGHRRRTS